MERETLEKAKDIETCIERLKDLKESIRAGTCTKGARPSHSIIN